MAGGRRADLGQPLHAAPARFVRSERPSPYASHPDQGGSAARLNSRMSAQVAPRRTSETRPKLTIEGVEVFGVAVPLAGGGFKNAYVTKTVPKTPLVRLTPPSA